MRNCLPSHEASRHTKGGPPDPFEASIVSDEGGQGWACGLFGRSGRYQGARFFRPVSSGPATLHPGRAGGAPGTFTQPRPDRILILRGVSAVFIGGTFLRPEYAQTVARCQARKGRPCPVRCALDRAGPFVYTRTEEGRMYDHDVKDAKPDRPTYSDARVTDAVYDPFFGMDHPARITVNRQLFVRQGLFDQAMGIAADYKANAADALDDLEEAYDVIESLNAQIDSLEVRIESAVQALRGRK